MSIRDNYLRVLENVNEATRKSGRSIDEVTLVAVTKFISMDKIAEAIEAGAYSVGENRVQELQSKMDFFKAAKVDINLIGQLQTNKVKYIIGNVKYIQSLDRLELAEEISKRALAAKTTQSVFVEVNIGKEEQKGGIEECALEGFLHDVSALPAISVQGLMCIPPPDDESKMHGYFAKMYKLFEHIKGLNIQNIEMKNLSMGMSGDYTAAILEGATMVRVGTAIFGDRV